MAKRRRKRNSYKGALIKGMSNPLPSSLLKEPYFKEALDEIMRGYAGVYALYRKKKLYYVGLATNLHHRIRGHTKNKHKGKWDSFAIFRVNRVGYLKDLETLLIRVATPRGNSVSGHVPRKANLMYVLKRISIEQMQRQRWIRKALR